MLKAYRIESTDCQAFRNNEHVMFVGGVRDGETSHVSNIKEKFIIDENHLFTVTDGKLYLDGKFVR